MANLWYEYPNTGDCALSISLHSQVWVTWDTFETFPSNPNPAESFD